jgi:hypothetical protein
MKKILMLVEYSQMKYLTTNYPETGMNFQVTDTDSGLLAVLEDSIALPFYDDPMFYCVNDLVAGIPIPTRRDHGFLTISQVFPDRITAFSALQAARISPAYTGTAGAVPLIASYALTQDTIFYRCLSTNTDPRYIAGNLQKGTYLTTALDQNYANSGFATVGRYALPIPLPASHVIQYELPKGTAIMAGTVAPMFGQSGGGVEVQLPNSQAVKQIGQSFVADY